LLNSVGIRDKELGNQRHFTRFRAAFLHFCRVVQVLCRTFLVIEAKLGLSRQDYQGAYEQPNSNSGNTAS